FWEGLSKKTRLEMARLSQSGSACITEYISKIEEKIIQETTLERLQPRNNKRIMTATAPATNPMMKGKWCNMHKTSAHDNTECFMQKKRNAAKTKSPDNKTIYNYLLLEDFVSTSRLEFQGKLNNVQVVFNLDTGADENYISESLAAQINHAQVKRGDPKTIQLANGTSIETDSCLSAAISFEALKNISITETFRVIPSKLDNYAILGLKFLDKNDVVIDFKSKILKIQSNYIVLPTRNNKELNIYDQQLFEKLHATGQLNKENYEQELENFIKTHKLSNPTLGCIPVTPYRMFLIDEKPIASKPYSFPHKLVEPVKREIQRLLDAGIINKSSSHFAAPAFPLLKKNNDVRLVVDYRKLNAMTIKEAFPFPNIWEMLSILKGAKIFSQIDLKNGYHQIPLDKRDQHLTAFVTPWGHYEYSRLPFGLTNAPRAFQRIMSNILSDLPFVKVFLDDTLIFSKNKEEHLQHLKLVFSRLAENHVSVNYEKSHFMQDEVTYLGCIVNAEGIKPDISKISNIQHMHPPSNVKQLLKILGFINWFRPFIQGLSSKIASLCEKTKKNIKFKWTAEDNTTLRKILNDIRGQPMLCHADVNLPFELHTDASDSGIGGVLTQQDKLIGLFSAKYKGSEKNYTTSEKEFLAILRSLEHFRCYLFNSPVTVLTDHYNNTYNKPLDSSRIERWKTLLCDYDYRLVYKAGEQNEGADILSRAELKAENIYKITTTDKIRNTKTLLDEEESFKYLLKAHNDLSHPGTSSLYNTIKPHVSINNVKAKIKRLTEKCTICQTRKPYKTNYGEYMGKICTTKPFTDISSDVYGPISEHDLFLRGGVGKIYLLTITDRFTRTTAIIPLKIVTSALILKIIENRWIKKYGKPSTILTDQGRYYISSEFENRVKELGIKHYCSTTYHPQGNGLSERLNQTIARVLRCFPEISIKEICKRIEFTLNNTYHSSLGCSPHELTQSFSHFDPHRRTLPNSYTSAVLISEEANKRNLKKINDKRIAFPQIKLGDKVWKRVMIRKKYDDFFEGPFLVIEKYDNGVTFKLRKNDTTCNAHINQLRPFKGEVEAVMPSQASLA
ncbi:hypothetical protein ENBRE01_3227, partial [Enteropsectra breve]